MTETAAAQFVPPYISFAQLLNVLERMAQEGVPGRIDRSYLATWSGSAQAQFLKAAESVGLRDEHGRPTDTLKRLVAEPDARPAIIGEILREHYAGAIALGEDATSAQLDEVFREFPGISGSTTRKAITFYLHAAKFAGIPTSKFFTAGRGTGSGSSGARAPRARNTRRERQVTSDPPEIPKPAAKVVPALIGALVGKLPAGDDGWTQGEARAWLSLMEQAIAYEYEIDLPPTIRELRDE